MNGAVRAAFVERPLDQVLPYLVQNHPECQFLQDYLAFCWQFGMSPPTWPQAWRADDRHVQVLLVIKRCLLGEGQDARTLLATAARERAIAEAELQAAIERTDRTKQPCIQQLLTWAHYWTPQLDNRGWLAGYIYVRLLGLMLRTGELLVQEGVLDDTTDVYLLTPEDLTKIGAAASAVEQRQCALQCKHAYERYRRLTPPAFLGRPPTQPEGVQHHQQGTADALATSSQPVATPGTVLKGSGLAPGRVTGRARKTDDLNDAAFLDSLTSEDILLYPGDRTWPDWLSLFTVVKGVVTVQGVQLHHATQIARECGVPYIDLPAHAWESLPDKVLLALDGAEGTVTFLG